jgi:hypothetical protein
MASDDSRHGHPRQDDERSSRESEFSRRELLRAGSAVPVVLSAGWLAACGSDAQNDAHGDHTDAPHDDAAHTDTHSDGGGHSDHGHTDTGHNDTGGGGHNDTGGGGHNDTGGGGHSDTASGGGAHSDAKTPGDATNFDDEPAHADVPAQPGPGGEHVDA